MAQVNFTEMYLIPKEIYLKFMNQKCLKSENEIDDSSFFSNKTFNLSQFPTLNEKPTLTKNFPPPPHFNFQNPGDNNMFNTGEEDLGSFNENFSFGTPEWSDDQQNFFEFNDQEMEDLTNRPNFDRQSNRDSRSRISDEEKMSTNESFKTQSSYKVPAYSKRQSSYPDFDKTFSKEQVKPPHPSHSASEPSENKTEEPGSRTTANSPPSTPPPPPPKSPNYPSFDKTYSKEEFKRPNVPPPKKSRSVKSSSEKKSDLTNKSKRPQGLQAVHNIHRILSSSEVYSIMGLDSNCSNKELEQQFKRVSKLIHPDKCHHPRATEAFQKFFSAYNAITKSRIELEEKTAKARSEEILRRKKMEEETLRKKMEEEERQKTRDEFAYFRPPPPRNSNPNPPPPSFGPSTRSRTRGPPTTSYSSSPLRPPPGASAFNNSFFKQSGRGVWFSL